MFGNAACVLLVSCGMLAQVMADAFVDSSSPIKTDERVVLFPTVALQSPDGRSWRVLIHGWIFEPETGDILRSALFSPLRQLRQLEPSGERSQILSERVRAFTVDNESGKRLRVRIADRDFQLAASAVDGHFLDTVELPADAAAQHARSGRLTVRALTPPGDNRPFIGTVHLLAPRGVSVISDIDDTVKVTEVWDKKKVLQNTFLNPFQPVEGMSQLYGGWAARGVCFHFVSSSPWQLYEALAEFLDHAGFPPASFHLKRVRFRDPSLLELFADPFAYKVGVIEQLLRAYPQRRFIMVGDSGEQDPEVYGHIARGFPSQIAGIFIRQVTSEPREAPRYEAAMKDVPAALWQLFRHPQEIPALNP